MFSKSVVQKMIGEVTIPTLLTLARESLAGVGETPDEKSQEAVSRVEMVVAELRRRMTPQATVTGQQNGTRTRRRSTTTTPPQPQQEGGQQND